MLDITSSCIMRCPGSILRLEQAQAEEYFDNKYLVGRPLPWGRLSNPARADALLIQLQPINCSTLCTPQGESNDVVPSIQLDWDSRKAGLSAAQPDIVRFSRLFFALETG